MNVIADLHIHSRFSRACSNQITIPNLEKYARMKGINLIGTGDFTHPLWNRELKGELKDDGSGILRTGSGFQFILTSEVANIFTQGGKGRRVHNVILAPSFDVVEQINAAFLKRGRLDYDGRPMFGFSCAELVRMMGDISDEIEIIPAHAWTPWFGVFGSESGFDSLKDAFLEQEKHVHAIETGMSSDPEMNWRISGLNSRSIVSFSDAHSFWPWRLGREATIFERVESYKDIITIETDPAYGKYHWDGHRLCNFSCPPAESKKLRGLCPVCGRGLTIGVEYRVEQITDQPIENHPGGKPYHKMLPLHEVISAAKSWPLAGRKTWELYGKLIEGFGNEFNVLLHASEQDIGRELPHESLLAGLILQNREGRIKVKPGFDGVYGSAMIGSRAVSFESPEPKNKNGSKSVSGPAPRQRGLSDFA
jgi:uncharacterized protein (TIGR00375 family)